MARWIDAKCRLCRREGIKLYLKGAKCDGPKCPVAKRETPPGQHPMRRRMTDYGLHLREKQRAKRIYGLQERAFKRQFAIASRMKGNTGQNLMRLLEGRLDNVLYRSGWATSHAHARQVIAHGHVRVNDRRVDIPSYPIRPSDRISPVKRERSEKIVRAALEETRGRPVPSWLLADAEGLLIKMTALPDTNEIPVAIRDQWIVEFASR